MDYIFQTDVQIVQKHNQECHQIQKKDLESARLSLHEASYLNDDENEDEVDDDYFSDKSDSKVLSADEEHIPTNLASRVEVKSARFRPPLNRFHSVTGCIQETKPDPIFPTNSGEGYNLGEKRGSVPNVPFFNLTQQTSTESDSSVQDFKPQPTWAEIAKLESQIHGLKRLLQASKKEEKLTPDETVGKILTGKSYSLERYRSKEEKLELLDEAIATFDGGTITTIILFLHDSINSSVFESEMLKRPVAIEHYIAYLRDIKDTDRLVHVLGLLGRKEEIAMFRYREAVSTRQIDNKLALLQICQSSYFLPIDSLQLESEYIDQQVLLIQRQLQIQAADKRCDINDNSVCKIIPQPVLIDTSVITTLFYCCLCHDDLTEDDISSPASIQKAHSLNEKQYLWVALSAKAHLKQWKDVEKLFKTKSWLGVSKMKSVIGFDRIVSHLSRQFLAPRTELNKYCNAIENLDYRLRIGLQFGCHESVIQTYSVQKDRLQLIAYQSKLQPNTPEWQLAFDILRNSSINWKN